MTDGRPEGERCGKVELRRGRPADQTTHRRCSTRLEAALASALAGLLRIICRESSEKCSVGGNDVSRAGEAEAQPDEEAGKDDVELNTHQLSLDLPQGSKPSQANEEATEKTCRSSG